MFRTLIANEIARRGISVREAARQMGLPTHSTLNNILAGKMMDIDTADTVCKWLGVPLSAAVEDATNEDQAISAITAVLSSAPELRNLFIKLAGEVTNGNLTMVDYKEIVAYAAFKLEQSIEHNKLHQGEAKGKEVE
jgi:transcriptional regulator with XRE-family HTH domain